VLVILLGEVHNGIFQMFKVIEFARMMVGTKAIATLSTGYQQALKYAKERVQGGDMKVMNDKASPRVTIINHPDVRRSLNGAEGLLRRHARTCSLHRIDSRCCCAR
jgi:alkylation response protein AidB-like acyl-CoA dehydrogenase